MLYKGCPAEAYRKVELDACVAGSTGPALLRFCLGDVQAALTRALWAHRNGAATMRREALLRAQNGLAALRVGVDAASPIGPALLTFYDGQLQRVLAAQAHFEMQAMEDVRADLAEVAQGLFAA